MNGDLNDKQRRLRANVGRSIAQLADGMIRGVSAPTELFTLPGGTEQVSQRHARAVLDLCLRIGVAMLATGASAADVVATLLRIGAAYRVEGMHVDITFTSISISVNRGADEDPMSIMRIVRVRTTDYTRLQNVYRLIEEITGRREPLDVGTARQRLHDILTGPHPYRRWVVVFGKAILAAGVVVMFGVSFVLVGVAAATAVISDLITRRLTKWSVPAFFAQLAAAVAMTSIAVFVFWLRSVGIELPGANHPTVIVIAGIIMLLSGIGLTAAARDAIDGYYVTASARGLEVIMLTLGLAVGISITLGFALRLGVPVTVATTLGDIAPLSGIGGAAMIGVGFALTSYIRLRLVPLFALVAGAVFAVFLVVEPFVPQPGLAPGIAGIVAGIIGYLCYRWLKVPEAAITMAGVIGLIPGLAVYRGLYQLMDSEFGVVAALPSLVSALATGVGLAAGTTIGAFVTRRAFGLDRAATLALRRDGSKDSPAS